MPKDLGRVVGPIVIPNCVEVDLVWNLASGKQVKNVLHGQVAVGFSATAAIAQAVYAALLASASWTAYVPFVHSTASLQGINLRDLRSAGFPLVTSTGAATAGTGAGSALPPGVSAIITLRTANAGRGFRGRVYLPGLDSTVLTAATGAFTGAFQTAAQNFMTAVGTALSGSSITLSLGNPPRNGYTSLKTGRVFVARPGGPVNVTSNSMRLLAAGSQRRRSYVA